MKNILDAVKTRLYATSSLTTLLGGATPRIYLDSAPADTTMPLIVYKPQPDNISRMFGGDVRHQFDIQFEIYVEASNPSQLHTLAAAIGTAFSTTLTVTGFDRATVLRQTAGAPSFADSAWSMVETYSVVAHDV
jgi:hypothetical protein